MNHLVDACGWNFVSGPEDVWHSLFPLAPPRTAGHPMARGHGYLTSERCWGEGSSGCHALAFGDDSVRADFPDKPRDRRASSQSNPTLISRVRHTRADGIPTASQCSCIRTRLCPLQRFCPMPTVMAQVMAPKKATEPVLDGFVRMRISLVTEHLNVRQIVDSEKWRDCAMRIGDASLILAALVSRHLWCDADVSGPADNALIEVPSRIGESETMARLHS